MGHEAGSMSHSIVEGEPDDYNTHRHHHYHHLTQGLRQLELSPTTNSTSATNATLPHRGTRILKTGSNAGESVYGVHGWIALYSIFQIT